MNSYNVHHGSTLPKGTAVRVIAHDLDLLPYGTVSVLADDLRHGESLATVDVEWSAVIVDVNDVEVI